MASYSSLTTFRKCPRLYGFGLLKYRPIEVPEPLMTGQLVHAAIAAHFKGTDWREAIFRAKQEAEDKLRGALDIEKATKALKALQPSGKELRY